MAASDKGEENMFQPFDYIIVAGYGWSGSSAVVDLLKEFDTCWGQNNEFRVVTDPYGIHDLHHSIVDNWDMLNIDIAIKDFCWHMEHLNYVSGKFSFKKGLGYKTVFDNNFWQSTNNFLEKLISYKYSSHWFFLDYKKDGIKLIVSRILEKMRIYEDKMYFSCVSDKEFCEYAQEYIDELFRPLIRSDSIKYVILDQGVHVQNYSKQMKYIRNSKLVVVDRDPRDIYADLVQGKYLIGRELAKSHDVMKYVELHRAYRQNQSEIKNDPNVLFIQFEDLVYHYENVVPQIADFLNLKLQDHAHVNVFFDPEISKNNIGIWKRILSEQEKQVIEAELGEYIPDDFY